MLKIFRLQCSVLCSLRIIIHSEIKLVENGNVNDQVTQNVTKLS